MGEGYPFDSTLMSYVTSANIACGFHAGDDATMLQTAETAIAKGVAIGAHPGYRDREHFGRSNMHLPPESVYRIVTEQVNDLARITAALGGKISHVKPHGALYNQAAKDSELAATVANAVFDFDADLILFGLANSHSITEAEKFGLRTASEVFVDRTYQSDGSLTLRSQPNALINDTRKAIGQLLQMVLNQTVTAVSGEIIPIKADTICIHGDAPQALEFARAVNEALVARNIGIASF